MGMKAVVRSVAIGALLYGGAKVLEFYGVCKGIVIGCRAAVADPEHAQEVVDDWDDVKAKWEAFKASRKA